MWRTDGESGKAHLRDRGVDHTLVPVLLVQALGHLVDSTAYRGKARREGATGLGKGDGKGRRDQMPTQGEDCLFCYRASV